MTNNDHLTPVEPPALDKEASSGTRHLTGIYLKKSPPRWRYSFRCMLFTLMPYPTPKSFIVILFFLVVF